ncbi:toprim domain-containing protein [Chlorogloea sp. CCALA 695]|uniref:toprim domain-containing protein n=1 Tax=Chlorogloea sp. CCALA 695 TaxID=2107693 RepID=UPI00210163C0|nr:toprim domain-containing protein [Chlorogloea sp. CCALA 695]
MFGFLQKLLSRAVVVALDSDTDGEKMAQKILAQLPHQAARLCSKAKDWHEELKKDLELALQPKQTPE